MTLAQLGSAATTSRTSSVLAIIKAAILNGRLEAGRPLVENDLARELGVSKTPVREALKTLAGSGLVVIRPYTGATVRDLTEADARAVYDMRLLLEPEAVRRSIAAGADLTAAQQALQQAAEAPDTSVRSIANRDFHRALYAGCGNPLLVQTLDGLRDQTALVSAASWARTASWELEAEEHRQILQTARGGDPAATAAMVAAHVGDFARRRLSSLATPGEEAEH